LAVWGQNDPFFLPAGAEAFRRDVPDAEVHFIQSGHFPLETNVTEVARLIRAFLARVLHPNASRLDVDGAPIAARSSFDQMRQLFGFVPNLAVAMAAEPSALAAYLGLLEGLSSSALSPLEQQLVMVAASVANEAPYNIAVHATAASLLGGDPELVKSAAEGGPLDDAKLAALRRFAEALTVGRGQVSIPVVERLRAAGYGQPAIVAETLGVAAMTFATGVAHLTRPAIDAAFVPASPAAVTTPHCDVIRQQQSCVL
jgi:AhpD family alkylhydroperoxidase